MDLRFTNRGFHVLTGHHWASYLHKCASVTKQYNLVPAKGVISLVGKVTAGLVKVTAAYHWVYDYLAVFEWDRNAPERRSGPLASEGLVR